MVRKAVAADADAVAALYERVHDGEEAGRTTIGWIRGVYPTAATVRAALDRDDLFVMEEGGAVVAAAIINQIQVPEYANCPWADDPPPEQVMVLHTLAVDPQTQGRGYGKAFVAWYEGYALSHGCPYLRMDTNERNTAARSLYAKLGYAEPGIVDCTFNGIPGVKLVCLEKKLTP